MHWITWLLNIWFKISFIKLHDYWIYGSRFLFYIRLWTMIRLYWFIFLRRITLLLNIWFKISFIKLHDYWIYGSEFLFYIRLWTMIRLYCFIFLHRITWLLNIWFKISFIRLHDYWTYGWGFLFYIRLWTMIRLYWFIFFPTLLFVVIVDFMQIIGSKTLDIFQMCCRYSILVIRMFGWDKSESMWFVNSIWEYWRVYVIIIFHKIFKKRIVSVLVYLD